MMLTLEDVSFGFEGDPVLRDLSLTIEPGEVVAVIGPSGVGKTTLLRLMALNSRPHAGTVTFAGTDAWAVDTEERLDLRRRIGMVFQGASLFDASVRRNVEYGLRIRQSWRDRLRSATRSAVLATDVPGAVRDALALVDMSEAMSRRADSLSGGEAQRVSFARAVAYDPDLLLLDEPTSDLDPRNTAVIEEAVAAAGDRGLGVVIATHDMHQAERVADRVAVLLGPNFSEIGPTEAVFDRPSNERTRQFISGELVYTDPS